MVLRPILQNAAMTKFLNAFSEHPASVGETYAEHLGAAMSFGFSLVKAGVAAMIHAVLPFLFTNYASLAVAQLNLRMVTHRDRRAHGARRAA